jgi:peroxiredoxin
MKKLWVHILLAALVAAGGSNAFSQEKKDVKSEMSALVDKVKESLKADKKSPSDLEPFLKEFDAIYARHKSEKTDETAQLLYMKAMLYLQVLDDEEKGVEVIKLIKKDLPDTEVGKNVDDILKGIDSQKAVKEIQRKLAVGTTFPDFTEKDLDGKPLSIANYKGKIVLIDFWATWCGPCVKELPNVLKTYEKHHAQGFEIIGISLDNEEKALRDFIKSKNMTWVQYFDGKGWQSKLAGIYGVNSIPATYLLDGTGKILGKNLRGDELEAAVAKAVPAK